MVGQIPQGGAVPAKGPRRTHGILRLFSPALTEHTHQQSDRIRLRHDQTSYQEIKGMSHTRWHAAQDVQAGPMLRAKLEKTTRI